MPKRPSPHLEPTPFRQTCQPARGEFAPPKSASPGNTSAEPLASPEPPWVTAIRDHWRVVDDSNRRKAVEHLQRARDESNVENCLRETKDGLKSLGIDQMQIIKLILTRYMDVVPICGHSQAPRHLAEQMYCVLKMLQSQQESAP